MLGAMLGGLEIAIIILVILLIFGPSKLPQLGEGIGKMLRGFRKEMKQLDAEKREDELRRGEIDVTPKADEKPKYTGPG